MTDSIPAAGSKRLSRVGSDATFALGIKNSFQRS